MAFVDPDVVEEECAAIRAYLDNPPYYGRSEYRNLREVKQHAGPTCCYDAARKLWGTTCTFALQELIVSNKWEPIGLTGKMHAPLVREARRHRAQAEAEWVAKQEADKAAAEAAEVAARRNPASWLVSASKSKKAKPPPAPAPAPAPTPTPADTAHKNKAPSRFGVEPTAAEVDTCAWLGLTAQAIAYSDTLNELGPRGTLSNEGRILRWCEVLTSDARHNAWELDPDDYFNPDVYLAAARRDHLDWAKNLNQQAAEAAEAR
mgnify:FL=1